MTLEHAELTGKILAAAIEVHKRLGPGFLESVYENALALELKKRSIPFRRQLPVAVVYDGIEVGQHRLDLFVADLIVVELKAIKSLEMEHFAIVKSYLRAVGREHGLLLNFSKAKLEARRVMVRG